MSKPEYSVKEIPSNLTGPMLQLLSHVHVNMPWKVLPQHLLTVLTLKMNVEIGFEATELDALAPREFEPVAERLHGRGCRITLHGPFWGLEPAGMDPMIRQISRYRIQQFFDLIAVFDPVQVVCHTGYDPRHYVNHEQSWVAQSVAFWEPFVKRAESLKTPVLLENVWEAGPGFHRGVFERLRSPCFGFCLDVGHQNSFSTTPMAEWLEGLGDFLMELHLHDNDGSLDQHRPVGSGNVDFQTLFRFLRSAGKDPLMTLEPHREEDLAETLEGLIRVMGV
ncbi:MAG: sugar phosphate isomerase/epimerase [Syntrophobacteraceae bacterium]|jgi:sugar phosphate isomerase/epimerase|nr:sugar phosphate isomerase/epimerase [Syntrophobacteraceae bacterium]